MKDLKILEEKDFESAGAYLKYCKKMLAIRDKKMKFKKLKEGVAT